MSSRGWWLVVLSAVLQVAANLLLRAGVRQGSGLGDNLGTIIRGLLELVRHPLFDAGIVLYGVSAIVWLRTISTEPLSTAYPLLVSLSFILVTAGAIVLFHEPLTWAKIAGLGIIVAGILVLGKT
jgi:multidrug transporter EmrE-like cation transporter